MRRYLLRTLGVFALFGIFAAAPARAADPAPFTQAQLDQMLAPIALYPDALLAQVLTAATYPHQVADAGRFLDWNGTEVPW